VSGSERDSARKSRYAELFRRRSRTQARPEVRCRLRCTPPRRFLDNGKLIADPDRRTTPLA
jgi:hypothetical protein